ncbi:DPP IV N-terminal domain-containing protein [Halalkalibaculum sp. DA3122]|uniref:DPP IV N-terminal domain-containing protein n=1 Tax=unclassified Halalkalibaculum TaxID=2964617 RepID=UPI0037549504
MMKNVLTFILLIAVIAACGESTTGPGSDTDNSEPDQEEPTETTGSLEVSVSTSGSSTDEDGYTITLGSGESESVEPDGSVTFTDLEEETYSVELSGLESYCTVDGDNPVSAEVTAGETASVSFDVTCEQSQSEADGTIVFMKQVDQSTIELFRMNADGSDQQRLGDGIEASFPAVSPDGSKVAYTHESDIWIADIDGSNQTRLTTNAAGNFHAAWSPDGSEIAYGSTRNDNHDIYIMDLNGESEQRLTVHEASDERPSWSPDGNSIIFSSDRDGDDYTEIHSIDVESGEATLLMEPTQDNGINLYDPAWSPDGSKIAYQGFTRLGNSRIFVADADGGNAGYITSDNVAARQPSWSPDGNYISFMSLRDGESPDQIWTVGASGENQFLLVEGEGNWMVNFPSWGPTVE